MTEGLVTTLDALRTGNDAIALDLALAEKKRNASVSAPFDRTSAYSPLTDTAYSSELRGCAYAEAVYLQHPQSCLE